MNPLSSFLSETLEAWRDARQGIIAEVANIPEDRFDFRPTADTKNVIELVQHILEVSMMMTGELTRRDTDLKRLPWPKMLEEYAADAYRATTKAQLLELLESQMVEAEQRFHQAGELSMMQFLERFDGEQGTKMQWLHHGIAQEMYHRGQLTLYARLMGLEPALTKRIRGAE